MVGAASLVASYFNVLGAASERSTHLEQKVPKLKELQTRLTSANEDYAWRLQEQEAPVQILQSNLKKKKDFRGYIAVLY